MKRHMKIAFGHWLRRNVVNLGMSRVEYNRIFVQAWKSMINEEEVDLSKKKENVCTHAYKKTGIYPHDDAPERKP